MYDIFYVYADTLNVVKHIESKSVAFYHSKISSSLKNKLISCSADFEESEQCTVFMGMGRP